MSDTLQRWLTPVVVVALIVLVVAHIVGGEWVRAGEVGLMGAILWWLGAASGAASRFAPARTVRWLGVALLLGVVIVLTASIDAGAVLRVVGWTLAALGISLTMLTFGRRTPATDLPGS